MRSKKHTFLSSHIPTDWCRVQVSDIEMKSQNQLPRREICCPIFSVYLEISWGSESPLFAFVIYFGLDLAGVFDGTQKRTSSVSTSGRSRSDPLISEVYLHSRT